MYKMPEEETKKGEKGEAETETEEAHATVGAIQTCLSIYKQQGHKEGTKQDGGTQNQA